MKKEMGNRRESRMVLLRQEIVQKQAAISLVARLERVIITI